MMMTIKMTMGDNEYDRDAGEDDDDDGVTDDDGDTDDDSENGWW